MAVALGACGERVQPPVQTLFQGSTMGTTFTVKVVSEVALEESEIAALEAEIEEELEQVNSLMSTYVDSSEVSRFNRLAAEERLPLATRTQDVVALALELGELTDGALDITVGPLVDAWGFGPERVSGEGPGEEKLTALRLRTGHDKLRLDSAAATLGKAVAGLRIDLSAVAKGYAVDQVAARLSERGHQRFMVEVGGELRVAGRNAEGQLWRIGVERPSAPSALPGSQGRVQRTLGLDGLAMATSGDYRNLRQVEGGWISHIIDPRTGRPVGHLLASVTVLHPSCAMADGLATALMVLGPDRGLALAEERDFPVLMLVREEDGFVERSSSAFDRLAESSDARG